MTVSESRWLTTAEYAGLGRRCRLTTAELVVGGLPLVIVVLVLVLVLVLVARRSEDRPGHRPARGRLGA